VSQVILSHLISDICLIFAQNIVLFDFKYYMLVMLRMYLSPIQSLAK